MSKNISYYLTAAAMFIALKFTFTTASNDDLYFILYPTDKIVGILTSSHSVYFPDEGYFHARLNILIDRSCSGFNFMLISFLVFAYPLISNASTQMFKILALPKALIIAYVLAIFVNASRIVASIVVQSQTKKAFPTAQPLVHEAVGIINNLTFLILAYCLIERLIQYYRAKPA